MAETEMHTSYGKVLRVDLTKSSLTEQDLDESTVRKYIGGRAFGEDPFGGVETRR